MNFKLTLLTMCLPLAASASGLTTPPSGDNQRATVVQHVGPVVLSVDYSSPRVHLNGEDRHGKIWGQLVPYGLTKLSSTCAQCPWRAGANENTTFTTSHPVHIQGQPLPAGTYGVHMIPGADTWTVIFSKNASSWGSFSYDAKDDALRVETKAAPSPFHEWLTYEFTEREPTRTTLALTWEDLTVPVSITVDDAPEIYAETMLQEMRSSPGFDWHNVEQVARYLLDNKIKAADALRLAKVAADPNSGGDDNVVTMMTLSRAQIANGQKAEAQKTRDLALSLPWAKPLDIHLAGRALLTAGDKEEAMKFFRINAKRFPNQWPVHVGLMRGYAALGDNPKALDEYRLALKQVPDEANRKNLEALAKKLEAGGMIN